MALQTAEKCLHKPPKTLRNVINIDTTSTAEETKSDDSSHSKRSLLSDYGENSINQQLSSLETLNLNVKAEKLDKHKVKKPISIIPKQNISIGGLANNINEKLNTTDKARWGRQPISNPGFISACFKSSSFVPLVEELREKLGKGVGNFKNLETGIISIDFMNEGDNIPHEILFTNKGLAHDYIKKWNIPNVGHFKIVSEQITYIEVKWIDKDKPAPAPYRQYADINTPKEFEQMKLGQLAIQGLPKKDKAGKAKKH